jgi:transposase-like protein
LRRTKLEPEIIIAAVQEYLSGKSSYKAIAKRLCVAPETLRGMG